MTTTAHARGPFDRPFCWYDGAIPYDFPEVFAPSSYSKSELKRVNSPRAGYMYNALGDWHRGHLAFTHTQHGDSPSFYAVYLDLLPAGQEPRQVPPRGWLGDGLPRRDLIGESTTGSDATKISLDDWNGDELIDIVYGEQYGQFFVMPNTGSAEEPSFPYTKILFDADGMPIDVGIHAAVLVADYEGDGANDLVVGDTYGKICYYRNLGPTEAPRFSQPQLVGDMKFRLLVDAVDWDVDGRMDVLAGTDSHQVAVFLNTKRDGNVPFREPIFLKLPQIKETRVRMVDLNRDGDQDLFVMSTQGSILVDRSFLKHGYARGRVLKLEEKPSP